MLVFLLLNVVVKLTLSQTTNSLSAQCSYTFYVPKSTEVGNQCEGSGTDGVIEDLKEQINRQATLYSELQKQMSNLQIEVTSVIQQNAKLLEENSRLREINTPGTDSRGMNNYY